MGKMCHLGGFVKDACKICSQPTTKIFTLRNSVKTQAVSKTLEKSILVPIVEMDIEYCGNCDFYQIDKVEYQHYDDEEYYLTTETSGTQRSYQQWFARYITNYISSPVVEIGPGDGYLGKLLSDSNFAYTGYEPAKKSFEQCQQKGINVINGYFCVADGEENKFAAVIGRQVLEHIDDAKIFLLNVRKSLKADGIAVFEVPNIDKARTLNRIVDFCPEHLNYFTLSSLSALFSACGYKVLDLMKSYDEEYLVITAAISTQFTLISPNIDFTNMVFWGAGSRGISLCHLLRAKPLYFVDSDCNKFNKFIPSTSIQIHPPSTLFNDANCTAVVITSFFYFDEVFRQLLNQRFLGEIYRINENNELVLCVQ